MASRMAATLSASSCVPHPNAHPPPPIAHAPNPIGVMARSLFPSRLGFMRGILKEKPTRCHAWAFLGCESRAGSVRLGVVVGELLQPGAAGRLPELAQPPRLDLPDALAGDAVLLGHLVERPRGAVL